MGSLFGKTGSGSTKNQFAGEINSDFQPLTADAATGSDALAKLLGGDSSGFDAYKAATGFDATAEQGSRGITGNAAAGGLLRSGGTGQALQAYGDNLQNQYASTYMQNLLSQAGLGFQAGNLISGSGAVTKSGSSDKSGLGGKLLGGLGTAAQIAAI